MKYFRNLAAIAAAAMTTSLLATPAAAQATRTWVSGVGDDVNPCSRTAPCKTFAGAITKTFPGGEIDCLDPGGFGGLTITNPITIDCTAAGEIGGVAVTETTGITVNVKFGQYVQLIGLDIDGLGASLATGATTTPGVAGVLVQSGVVLISKSIIYGFQGITGCGSVLTTGGVGVCVNGPAGTKVTIENSIIRNNGYGVINSPSAGANTVVIDSTVLDGNATANASNAAAGAKTYLYADKLVNCPAATTSTGGEFFTFSNNAITGTVSTLTPTAQQ